MIVSTAVVDSCPRYSLDVKISKIRKIQDTDACGVSTDMQEEVRQGGLNIIPPHYLYGYSSKQIIVSSIPQVLALVRVWFLRWHG